MNEGAEHMADHHFCGAFRDRALPAMKNGSWLEQHTSIYSSKVRSCEVGAQYPYVGAIACGIAENRSGQKWGSNQRPCRFTQIPLIDTPELFLGSAYRYG